MILPSTDRDDEILTEEEYDNIMDKIEQEKEDRQQENKGVKP